jgi:hypothetical protein
MLGRDISSPRMGIAGWSVAVLGPIGDDRALAIAVADQLGAVLAAAK